MSVTQRGIVPLCQHLLFLCWNKVTSWIEGEKAMKCRWHLPLSASLWEMQACFRYWPSGLRIRLEVINKGAVWKLNSTYPQVFLGLHSVLKKYSVILGKELESSITGRVDKQNVMKVYLDKYVVVRSHKQNVQEGKWMHLKNIVLCRKKVKRGV